jgi:hypothetical protein
VCPAREARREATDAEFLEELSTPAPGQRDVLIEAAWALNEVLPPVVQVPAGIVASGRPGDDYNERGDVRALLIVPHTEAARDVLTQARLQAEAEYAHAEARNDAVGTTVWGRVSEHSRKLALLYAISERHESPEIGRAAAEWAVRFVLHQIRRMLCMVESHVADNAFQALCLKAIRKLSEAPGRRLAHSALLVKMKIAADGFRKIIDTLEQRGSIVMHSQPTGGRTGRVYELIEGH